MLSNFAEVYRLRLKEAIDVCKNNMTSGSIENIESYRQMRGMLMGLEQAEDMFGHLLKECVKSRDLSEDIKDGGFY